MARLTYFVALPFRLTEDGEIAAGEAQDAGQALRKAASLASAPENCGAVAFSRTGHPAIVLRPGPDCGVTLTSEHLRVGVRCFE
jgi:hypothetical protein